MLKLLKNELIVIYANKPYSFEKTDVRGQKIKRIFSTMLELKNDSKHYLYALLGTVLFCKVTDLSILYKIFICSIVPNGIDMASLPTK